MTAPVFDIANIRRDKPKNKSSVLIYWLAGTGFSLKFASGEIVCIDPYLSDCVERLAGFKRLSLAPVTPHNLDLDLLLITHDHPDHLDPDSFADIMAHNPDAQIIAAGSCKDYLQSQKTVNYKIVKPTDAIKFKSLTIHAIGADHGPLCAESLGFLIETGRHKIYFTGDTCLNELLMATAIDAQPDILVPCINGAFGNLTERDAAVLACKCRAKQVIPAHFGLFAEHGGSPGDFIKHLKEFCPNTAPILLTPGRGVEI